MEQRKSGRALLGVSLVPWGNTIIWIAACFIARQWSPNFLRYRMADMPFSTFFVCGPVVLISCAFLLLSIPAWYMVFFQRAEKWKDGTAWRADVVYGLGWATNFFLAWADPTHFARWFLGQVSAWFLNCGSN